MSGPDPADPSDPPAPSDPAGGRGAGAPRRGLTVVVLTAVAGGAAGYFATGRVWASATVERVAPLPPEAVHTTGRDLVPWAAGAALVGAAGGLALLAARGLGRLAVAVLLGLAGIATAVGGVRGLTGDSTFGWPLLCVAGGALVLAAGVVALARGRGWAAMGARYDAPSPRAKAPAAVGPDAPPTALWDALDRGDDPTR
ncbi:Trp biosynthesis-associated membrane protein [Cryptosporangium minutisporangium]|uniref:Trp biosynthesis-associated membrane protein n=1 Tax=Cryptosporangium minutisporangium TaxID=113569 RepID=UPI0035E9EA4B